MKYILLLSLLSYQVTHANEANETSNQRPQATGFIYGAGVAYQQQLYKGFDQRTIALPLIGYVGENLNVFGPFVSYSFYKKDDWKVDVNLSPRFSGYEASDSPFFEGMSERKDSLDAGFSLNYSPANWTLKFSTLSDVLSKSKGNEFSFMVANKHKIGLLSIEPSVTISQFDNDLSDYYFGVLQNEATDSRSYYEGTSSVNKTVGVAFTHPLPIGLLRLDVSNTWYGSGITDSPLVDSDKSFSTRLFFIGFF